MRGNVVYNMIGARQLLGGRGSIFFPWNECKKSRRSYFIMFGFDHATFVRLILKFGDLKCVCRCSCLWLPVNGRLRLIHFATVGHRNMILDLIGVCPEVLSPGDFVFILACFDF